MNKFNQLFALALTLGILGFAACNKTNSLTKSTNQKPESQGFTTDHKFKQTLLHHGLDLSVKDEKSLAQHNRETVEMAKSLQQRYEKEHPGELLQASFEVVEGRLVAKFEKSKGEHAAQLGAQKSQAADDDCSSKSGKEYLDCAANAILACLREGGKPVSHCYNCQIICAKK